MGFEDSDLDLLTDWVGSDTGLVAAMKSAAKLRVEAAGNTLIREGDLTGDVFMILSGRVSIVIYSPNGHEVRLGALGPGEWVGEMAALNGGNRSAFAVVAEPARLASFSAAKFISFMESDSHFATKMARLLSQRLADTSLRMFEFAAFSAAGRVYAEMIRMSKPEDDTEERHLVPAPSVTELAARLSLTRETTSRVISRLERMQLLVRDPRHWRVLAPETLSEMIS